MVVWVHRYVYDVVNYTDAIDIPKRWLLATTYGLAKHLFLQLPVEEAPAERFPIIEKMASEFLIDAENNEVDHAPIRLAPNTSAYTR